MSSSESHPRHAFHEVQHRFVLRRNRRVGFRCVHAPIIATQSACKHTRVLLAILAHLPQIVECCSQHSSRSVLWGEKPFVCVLVVLEPLLMDKGTEQVGFLGKCVNMCEELRSRFLCFSSNTSRVTHSLQHSQSWQRRSSDNLCVQTSEMSCVCLPINCIFWHIASSVGAIIGT